MTATSSNNNTIILDINEQMDFISRPLNYFSKTGLFLLTFTILQTAQSEQCQIPYPRQVVDAILNDQLGQAQQIILEWKKSDKNSVHADFYATNITLARAKKSRGESKKQLNKQALFTFQAIRNRLDQLLSPSAKDELILGMTEAFSARIYMENKKWFKAYRIGRKARNRLRNLVKQYPEEKDAYLALGLYEYYTGKVPMALKWLTALIDLSGNWQKGIGMLQQTVENAPVASPETARILLDELELGAPLVCQWLPLNEQFRGHYNKNADIAYSLQKNYRLCGFADEALKENLKSTDQFSENRTMRARLQHQRLLIFRDQGDVKSIVQLQKKYGDAEFYLRTLRQARDVAKKQKNSGYSPPPTINNASSLRLKFPCQKSGEQTE